MCAYACLFFFFSLDSSGSGIYQDRGAEGRCVSSSSFQHLLPIAFMLCSAEQLCIKHLVQLEAVSSNTAYGMGNILFCF